MNLVVFASGSGTNFQSLIDAANSGTLDVVIRGLITDRANIGALDRAEKHQIPTKVIDPGTYEDESEFSDELLKQLEAWNTDLIALAGYLKKIPLNVIQEYENRILNIHPSLLPKYGGKGFYGMRVHQAVVSDQASESGCTVHVVTQEFDEGPVVAQTKVDVLPDDTPEKLAARILTEEHKLYPAAIQQHIHNLQHKSH